MNEKITFEGAFDKRSVAMALTSLECKTCSRENTNCFTLVFISVFVGFDNISKCGLHVNF